ncbi:hypothetical protein BHE74_00048483 [Ensete ventricosum]|nr:hypothetical protein BHE74_00048483 [Ensete ventricosum]
MGVAQHVGPQGEADLHVPPLSTNDDPFVANLVEHLKPPPPPPPHPPTSIMVYLPMIPLCCAGANFGRMVIRSHTLSLLPATNLQKLWPDLKLKAVTMLKPRKVETNTTRNSHFDDYD